MAGADYRSCDVCGGKTFYDANLDYQKPDADHPIEWWLHGVGDWKVVCQKCAETHEVVIRPLAVTAPGEINFYYDVRRALGMNDKCGLSGLAGNVAEVRRIALRLRNALIAINATRGKPHPEEYVDGGASYAAAIEAWDEGQKALADAQFPRLWDEGAA